MTYRNHPFIIGAQFRAGRALVGWRRSDLAEAAGLHRNAVAYWEQQQCIPGREPHACGKMRAALLAAGVIAVQNPAPGVCRVGLTPVSAIAQSRSVPENFEEVVRRAMARQAIRESQRLARKMKCGARTRKGAACQALGRGRGGRCKFHGGMSTGPTSAEGKARISEAQRRRWNRWRTERAMARSAVCD